MSYMYNKIFIKFPFSSSVLKKQINKICKPTVLLFQKSFEISFCKGALIEKVSDICDNFMTHKSRAILCFVYSN